MPKLTFTKRSFSGGELSPQIIQSRSDIDMHSQGVSVCLNCIPLSTGSIIRRPPTRLYDTITLPPNASRILSFDLDGSESVLFIFGEKKMCQFSVRGTKSPTFVKEFDVPYTAFEAEMLDVARMGKLIVLASKYHPPHKIELKNDSTVVFEEMVFDPPPWLGNCQAWGEKVDAKLRVNLNDQRQGEMMVQSDSSLFKEHDVGRMLRLGWTPKGWKPKSVYPENSFILMHGKVYQSIKGGVSGTTFEDNVKDVYRVDGKVTWKLISSVQEHGTDKDGKSIYTSRDSHRSPYYVYGQIVKFNTPFSVTVTFKTGFAVTDDTSTSLWNFSAWGAKEGYPSHVSFYNNRLCFSGATFDPQFVYFSGFNAFNDFSPDTLQGDLDYRKSLSIAVTDDMMTAIRWFRPLERGLIVGTDTSIWIIILDFENGFNLISRRLSAQGAYGVRPLGVGDGILYAQGAGRRLQLISGATEQGFEFTELTQYVDHLFPYRISHMAYQEDPYSIAWIIDRRGQLLGCNIKTGKNGSVSWHTHRVGGKDTRVIAVSSVRCIAQGETTIWFLISRTKNDHKNVISLEKLTAFTPISIHRDGFSSKENG